MTDIYCPWCTDGLPFDSTRRDDYCGAHGCAPEAVEQVETRVVIRRFREGDLIALFPDIDEGRGMIQSYMRVGQHGPASPAIVDRTRPVDHDDADVQSLVRELRSVGYSPRLVRRLTRKA